MPSDGPSTSPAVELEETAVVSGGRELPPWSPASARAELPFVPDSAPGTSEDVPKLFSERIDESPVPEPPDEPGSDTPPDVSERSSPDA